MCFGVETETVPAYILLLNWVAQELQTVVVFSSETKCKRDLLIKSKDNLASQSGETPLWLNVLD
jgi:hypothetical protein